MSSIPQVTIDTKIQEAQFLIDEIKASKLDVEKRAKLIVMLQKSQFAAVTLKINVVKALARSPENPPQSIPLLGLPSSDTATQ
jgi:hypothetical protein